MEEDKKVDATLVAPDKKQNIEAADEIQELLRRLPEEMLVNALIEKVKEDPQGEITKIVRTASVSQQSYSGPIPQPRTLDEYERTHQGLADRLALMAEKEQSHRHDLEKTSLKSEINKDKRGQNYALATFILIFSGSIGLIFLSHEIAGTVLGGATLTGLAYIFISGRKPSSEEKTTKSANQ